MSPRVSDNADAPQLDLHFLRARDPRLDEFAGAVQSSAVSGVLCQVQEEGLAQYIPRKVLVTGSSGYLGATLARILKKLEVEVVGLDVQAADTTTVVGDVACSATVAAAISGCQAVLHTAALHAPNAPRHSEEEFIAVNCQGTQTLLEAARAVGAGVFVHTSTTSLMATRLVKDIEEGGGCAYLGLHSVGEPRNKYGRSKLQAEVLCERAAAETGMRVVVLRAPRFFPEDTFDSDKLVGSNNVVLESSCPRGEAKAVELIGTRSSLRDLADGHLRALAFAAAGRLQSFSKYILVPAPLLLSTEVSSCTGGAEAAALLLCQQRCPEVMAAFAAEGWAVPPRLSRLYDGTLACSPLSGGGLGWSPRWTFIFVLEALAGAHGEEAQVNARLGRY